MIYMRNDCIRIVDVKDDEWDKLYHLERRLRLEGKPRVIMRTHSKKKYITVTFDCFELLGGFNLETWKPEMYDILDDLYDRDIIYGDLSSSFVGISSDFKIKYNKRLAFNIKDVIRRFEKHIDDNVREG